MTLLWHPLFRERPGESVCVTLSVVQDASGSNFEHVFLA